MNTKVQAQLPVQLVRQAEQLVKDGWAANMDALPAEALQRYVESHKPQLQESFVREDVEWGLRGKE